MTALCLLCAACFPGSVSASADVMEATSVKLVYEALRSIRFSDTQLAMSCGATSSGS